MRQTYWIMRWLCVVSFIVGISLTSSEAAVAIWSSRCWINTANQTCVNLAVDQCGDPLNGGANASCLYCDGNAALYQNTCIFINSPRTGCNSTGRNKDCGNRFQGTCQQVLDQNGNLVWRCFNLNQVQPGCAAVYEC